MLDSLHLHLKTDSKPGGGKVSAVEKIDYINREGKYKDIDAERMKDHDLFQHAIFASNAIERHLDRDQLLYESPFGKIKQTKDGKIMVSKNASVETVAIALTVAARVFGNEKLILEGNRRFEGKAIVAGTEIYLPIHFDDKAIDKKYQSMRQEKIDEREKCNSSFLAGSRQLNREDRTRTSISLPYPKPDTGETLTTRERLHLPVLPQRDMEIRKTTRTAMLLRGAEGVHMDNSGTEQRGSVRWDIQGGGIGDNSEIRANANKRPRWNLGVERRKNAEETAKRILIKLQETLDKTYAYSHIQYINREAAFQKRGGCIGKGHFLPRWAEDDPKKFFEAADIYERANGERYKEIEFALPNELPFEAQREIVESFIQRILPNHYYAYAMHDKIGQMSDGEHNVHVHIMFTTRENDEYERTVGRDAKTFFSRANTKNPEKGGCRKPERWNGYGRQNALRDEIRPVAAEIINEMLERYGFDSRISEKSFEKRIEDAKKDGDKVLVKALSFFPEQHLDLKVVLRDDESVDEVKQRRQYKKALARDAYAAELMRILNGEKLLQKAIALAGATLDWLLKRKNTDKKNLLALRRQLDKNSKEMLWAKNSYLIAAKKFMSKDERKQFEDFLSLCRTKVGLEKMLISSDEEAKQNILARLAEIEKLVMRESAKVEEVFLRLKRQKLEVLKEQRLMLQKNKAAKAALIETVKNINKVWREEKENRKKQSEAKAKTYKLSDVNSLLMEQYRSAKESYEVQKTLVANLKKNVISFERAVLMAEGRFTGGDYKKLRADLRKLKKSEDYYQDVKSQYDASLALWERHGEGNPFRKADIDAQKKRLDERFVANYELRMKLEKEQKRLETLCSAPAAKNMIRKIALGIMAKNQPAAQEYEKALDRLNILQERLTVTQERIKAVRQQMTYGNKAIYKTIAQSGAGSIKPNIQAHKDAQTISDGLLGKEGAVPKVMQNPTGEDDDWSMLTESAKQEKLAETRFSEDWSI